MSRTDGATTPLHDRLKDMFSQRCARGEMVQVKETSKSWVFLTPHHVYKLKKQVRDALQDLTNLRARHDNTLTEIDLNRRLAPKTYLNAVRVTADGPGITLDGAGQTLDWLVKMERLPASRMLDQMILEGSGDKQVLGPFIDILASELVEFYRNAPRSNLKADELLTLLQDQQAQNCAVLLNPAFAPHHHRFQAVLDRFDTAFGQFFEMFVDRVKTGAILECNGDLRPEHICLLDPPVIFDCLEFNRNLRLHDLFSEVTFLGMECDMLGATWIKPVLINALKQGTQNHPPARLLQIYEAIHALLRVRLCLAHLLAPAPRTPEKWMPQGLRYLEIVERNL